MDGILYSIHQPYPHPIKPHQDLIQMLSPLVMLISLSGLKPQEIADLKGDIVLTHHRLGPMSSLTIDTARGTFEAIYHATHATHLEDPRDKMYLFSLHLVDSDSGLLQYLRSFSLSNAISQSIYQASQDPDATRSSATLLQNTKHFEAVLEGSVAPKTWKLIGPLTMQLKR